MIRFGVWHGGASYGTGDYADSMEMWEDLECVKYSLQRRYHFGHDNVHQARMIDESIFSIQSNQWIQFPAVDQENTYIDLYAVCNTAKWKLGETVYTRLYLLGGEPYERLTLGPRGGVVRAYS